MTPNQETVVSATFDLDAKIASQKAELNRLLTAKRKLLESQIDLKKAELNKFTSVMQTLNAPFEQNTTASKNLSKFLEIPKSVNDLNKNNYIVFIVNHLKNETDGLTIMEFCKKLNIIVTSPVNKSAIYKKLSRYFASMVTRGELIKKIVKGQRYYKVSQDTLKLDPNVLKCKSYKYRNYIPHNKGTSIGSNYGNIILNILQKEKNGLDFKNIRAKMMKIVGDKMDTRYLAVQICVMAKNGTLLKEGKRNSYKYKIAPSL